MLKKIIINFSLFKTDFKVVDKRFKEFLDIDLKLSHNQYTASNNLEKTIWRIMILRKLLLNTIEIPIFSNGSILEIEELSKGKYRVELLLPYVKFISENLYNQTLSTSFKILSLLNKKSITKYEIFDFIELNYMNLYKNISGSGKSTMPVLSIAYKKNIPFMHLGSGIYNLGFGKNTKTVNRSQTQYDSSIGSKISNHKVFTSNILRMAGLPSPEHRTSKTKEEAYLIAKQIGFPIVIKPVDQNAGIGVSLDLASKEEIENAFSIAYNLSKNKEVIIEKQIEGVCHRIFIVNGKMMYAVKRMPKLVVGNGKNNIKQLVEKTNKKEFLDLPPWKRDKSFLLDDLALESIKKQGYSLESIPKNNQLIPLRRIESTNWGGYNVNTTESMHPENIEIALKATNILNLHVAGVDIISSDISKPWHENGAIINEVNTSPEYGRTEPSLSTITKYLDEFISEPSRIPITVILGGDDALEKGRLEQEKQIANKTACFLTTNSLTLCDNLKQMNFNFNLLYLRIQALLMYKEVESLVVIIQNDEFLENVVPFDYIDKLIVSSKNLYKFRETSKQLSNTEFEDLYSFILSIQKYR